jgi:hypothetical protein
MRFGEERRAACSAIRNRLLKIAVRVRETGARIKLAFVAVAHDPGPVGRPGLKLLSPPVTHETLSSIIVVWTRGCR